MKCKFILLSMLAAVQLGSTNALALASQNIDLNQYTDFTTWNMYGSATAFNDTPGNGFTISILKLTSSGTGDQGGAAFAPVTTTLDFDQPFSAKFHFFIAPANMHGDGMTFVLSANDPATVVGGGPLVPSTGSDLGYAGTGLNGLAFAIDTFNFSGEPVAPSIQILETDSNTPVAYTETGVADISDLSFFQWGVQLDYSPSGDADKTGILTGTLTQFVGSQTYTVSATVDGNALGLEGVPLYYGFTAANGLADDGHFVTSATPVPEPETYFMLLAGLGLIGWRVRHMRAICLHPRLSISRFAVLG